MSTSKISGKWGALAIACIFLLSFPCNLFAQRLVLNGAHLNLSGGVSTAPVFFIVDNADTSGITRLSDGGHIYTEGQYDFVKWKADTGAGKYVFPFGTPDATVNFIPFTFKKTGSGSAYITASTWSTNPQNVPHPGVSSVPAVYSMIGTGDSLTTALDRFWDVRTSSPVTADVTFSYRGAENTTSSPTDQLKAQRWTGDAFSLWSSPLGTGNPGITSGIGTVGPITAQTIFTPFVLTRTTAPLQLRLPYVSYAALKKKLDGGYFQTIHNKLYFRYEEEYMNGALNYKLFDNQRVPISGLGNLTKIYGDNRYVLDLSSSSLVSGQYYTLEVTSSKNEVYLLKFKY